MVMAMILEEVASILKRLGIENLVNHVKRWGAVRSWLGRVLKESTNLTPSWVPI